jgi:prepilin-type N-terminal cleavage/methylation domain-containing protein
MPHLGRRGFTLIELTIALVLLGIISTAIYRVLVSDQRIYQAQIQRMDLQQNIRAAATILPADFRTLDAADGDIIAMASDSIKIRAMRVFGVICDPPVLGGALTARTLTVRQAMTFGSRAFTPATDSLLIYYEGDPGARSDDGWVLGKLTAAAALNCADGRPGTLLTTDLKSPFVLPQLNQAGMIPAGSPVYAFETLVYKLYQAADGNYYLGLRNANGLQPLIGPLTGPNGTGQFTGAPGMTLTYYDAAGAVTAVPANVAQIEIRVRGRSAQVVQLAQGGQVIPVDSITTRVSLRNNRRW